MAFTLENFNRTIEPSVKEKFVKKREQKGYDKKKIKSIVSTQIPMNRFGNVKSLFETLIAPPEIYQVPNAEK